MKRIWKILGIIVLFVTITLLIAPLLYQAPPLTGTVPERELADTDSRFVDVNGVTVHYKEMGQGEPVFILLHGFGASEFSWREVMEPLSNSGRVIAYDRPAFGLTERPMEGNWTGTNPYSVQGNVELLDGLMDELGVDKAILVGNSAGGDVAAAYAIEHPERVRGWCWWIQPWGKEIEVHSLNGQYLSWLHHKYGTLLLCWCELSPVRWEMIPSGWHGMIPPGLTRKYMRGIADPSRLTTGINRSTSSPLQGIQSIIPDVWRNLRCLYSSSPVMMTGLCPPIRAFNYPGKYPELIWRY